MLDIIFDFLNHGLLHASWTTKIVYFLIVTQLTIFSVTLYLHRSQAHRGVDFHPALAHVFRFWSWVSTGMSQSGGLAGWIAAATGVTSTSVGRLSKQPAAVAVHDARATALAVAIHPRERVKCRTACIFVLPRRLEG